MGYGAKSLDDYQYEVGKWAEKNFKREGRVYEAIDPFYGVVEEVGELSRAILKGKQNIRSYAEFANTDIDTVKDAIKEKEAKVQAKIKDAIGDIMIYLLDYCYRNKLDLQDILRDTWEEVGSRDWIKYPKNGKTE